MFQVWHELPRLRCRQINVAVALSQKIAILLDPHVDVPCSFVVT